MTEKKTIEITPDPASSPVASEELETVTGAAEAPEAPEAAGESKAADQAESAPEDAKAAEEQEGAESAESTEASENAGAAEVAALRDRLLRLQADFDNYRKRQARDRAEWIAQANADLLEDLLPALDQTDLALAAAQKDSSDAAKPFLDGFSLVRRTLLSSLARHGLVPVEDTVGKPLDTATSEAVTVMRTGQAKPGCVIYETRRGYILNGKVLRAAQVVVEDEPEADARPSEEVSDARREDGAAAVDGADGPAPAQSEEQ